MCLSAFQVEKEEQKPEPTVSGPRLDSHSTPAPVRTPSPGSGHRPEGATNGLACHAGQGDGKTSPVQETEGLVSTSKTLQPGSPTPAAVLKDSESTCSAGAEEEKRDKSKEEPQETSQEEEKGEQRGSDQAGKKHSFAAQNF